MRNIIFVILIISGATVFAQQSLEFSRVILIDQNVQTVPSGKVWKLENVLMPNESFIKFQSQAGGSCGCNSSSSYSRNNYITAWTATELAGRNNININAVPYAFNPSNNISSLIWLPAGTTVAAIQQTTPPQPSHAGGTGCYAPWWLDGVYQNCNPFTPAQITITPLISVIEFNVIP